MDEAFPQLSQNLMGACAEIGNPIKGKNPYITRDSPFYSTIFNCGGELNSGHVHTGVCRGMDAEFRAIESVTSDFYSGRLYGNNYEEEEEEIANNFSFAHTFPCVDKWMMSTGKNNLIIGRCARPGPFFRANKGKNVIFSTDFINLHSCFTAFENFLKPATKSRKRKNKPNNNEQEPKNQTARTM